MTDKNKQLVSTISDDNKLTLSLKDIEMPQPGADEVVDVIKKQGLIDFHPTSVIGVGTAICLRIFDRINERFLGGME